jgi:hypothetical protein
MISGGGTGVVTLRHCENGSPTNPGLQTQMGI